MSPRRWAVALTLAAGLWGAAPSAASGQQPVDSVALRIRESLRRLGRPPGVDTGAAAADTLPVTPIQVVPGRGAASATSADSIIRAILGLPGYAATQYRGTGADFDAEARVLVLHGDSTNRATVVRQGTQLSTDSLIRYDEAAQRIRGEGHPLFSYPEGDPVQSERVIYDVAANRGSAFGARTKYSEGATWFVTGDLPSVTAGVVYGAHTDFTSCELTIPHYHFTADNIKIIAGRILVARPVRLYFADVPVAWLPFVAQSLSTGRASGLLTPRFSINDIVRRGGYHRRISNIGFYWAMSDYADATVAMDWFSSNFTSVTGNLNYSWLRQFLNGTVSWREYWPVDGPGQRAIDANTDWRMDERTSLRGALRWSSSSEFVRRNSLDPVEVTQSINSTGGLERRFDWGSVSLSANRDQYLTDDRVVMTLPHAQLNLSQITLLRAPALRARWYNNLVWSGSANGDRNTTDYTLGDTVMVTGRNADQETLRGGVSSRFSLGNLGWSQSLNLDRGAALGLPVLLGSGSALAARALIASGDGTPFALQTRDIARTDLNWSTTLNYQQTLIGSTTITPSLSLNGHARRADTIDVARDRFVSAPGQLSFGARLQSDLFGFFPGVGPFQAIRHKLTPAIDFSFAPEVTSTLLQERVFGRQALQPRKLLVVSLNQTFEAKRKARTDSAAVGAADSARALAPTAATDTTGLGAGGLTTGGFLGGAPTTNGLAANGFVTGGLASGLRRASRADIVNLLALRMDAITYDFVEADEHLPSRGLWGFQTTRIGTQISSDFLQGLSVSMSHDLFAEDTVAFNDRVGITDRRFDLHLAQMNLGFSLSNRSGIVRALGLFRGSPDTVDAPVGPRTPQDPFVQTTAATDESSVIPRSSQRPGDPPNPNQAQRAAEVGSWSTNVSYSLVRPRVALGDVSQALNLSFTVKPTPGWDVSWRTSYDVERGAFNDHSLSLTRDIHDWDAHFDFARTATGNWFFRFDVALKANHDFKFDYKQHNTDALEPR
ncbi:MAG: LPS-assembly protein LptD [Gemmatimonadetes bacterium]|nr:LPS-assembly protein LptD [Gemmatimonadota bacterium]